MDKIGKNVASLVEDRACIQLGIGALSESTSAQPYQVLSQTPFASI
jgi:hypothetical protein